MGLFHIRSSKRTTKENKDGFIQKVESFDNASNDKSHEVVHIRSSRFANFMGRSRTAPGVASNTITKTPSTVVFTPEPTSSSSFAGDALTTTSDSVLDSLKIVSDSGLPFSSPSRSQRNVEIMTPESRHLMLQQREAIRKILFEKNQETDDDRNKGSLSPSFQAIEDNEESHEYDSSYETTESLRASPPPPPPSPVPPIFPSEDSHHSESLPSAAMAACLSQEVTYEGHIVDASLDVESDYEINQIVIESTSERMGQGPVTYDLVDSLDASTTATFDELHNLKLPSRKGRSMPISVDLSYTESELGSVETKTEPPPVTTMDTVDSKTPPIPISVDISYTESELASIVAGTSTMPEDTDHFHNISSFACRDPQAPSHHTDQPDDERAYDVNFREKVHSPMPDDEHMEYNKDEILEMTTEATTTRSGALNIVGIRHVALAPGLPSAASHPIDTNNTYMLADHCNEEIARVVDPVSHVRVTSLEERDERKDVPGQLGQINNEETVNGNDESKELIDSTIARLEYGKSQHSTNKSIFNGPDPKLVTRNFLNALNCVTDNEIYCGRTNDIVDSSVSCRQSINKIFQKTTNSQWDVHASDSLKENADLTDEHEEEICHVVTKTPSFVYTKDDEFTTRFIRRITKNGFVLLYLQSPGSLANPSEDWNGRTVTMTIEKGMLSPSLRGSGNKSKYSFTSISGCSSLTASSQNSGTSNRTPPPPTIKHPRLQWMTVAGGIKTDVLTTAIDLFNIQAIAESCSGIENDRSNTSDGDLPSSEDLCFFSITTSEGIVHMFEAASLEERERIVKGLKIVMARLSFQIISGNPTSTSELYSTSLQNPFTRKGKQADRRNKYDIMNANQQQLPPRGETQSGVTTSVPNPRATMDCVAHVLLD